VAVGGCKSLGSGVATGSVSFAAAAGSKVSEVGVGSEVTAGSVLSLAARIRKQVRIPSILSSCSGVAAGSKVSEVGVGSGVTVGST
jgi:hypothetical protein